MFPHLPPNPNYKLNANSIKYMFRTSILYLPWRQLKRTQNTKTPWQKQPLCWETCCGSCDSVLQLVDLFFLFITMLFPCFILSWMPWDVSQTCGCDLYASACCSKLCLMCASFSGSMCLVICIEFCAFSLLLPRPWSQNFHVRPQAVVSNLQKPSPPPKRLQV